MKLILIALSFFGYNTPKDSRSTTKFTTSEYEFINNVIKLNGAPTEVYRSGKYIQVNYPTERLQLGKDGFVHNIEIYINNEWQDVGPEF